MKKFKVIALSVGGSSNKIYHSQQIVDEACFYPEHIPELIAGGFIEEVEGPDMGFEELHDTGEEIQIVEPLKNKKNGATRPNKK